MIDEAVYVTVVAAWQRVDAAPDVNTGALTAAVTVTVCIAIAGPLQPVAATVAVIIEIPDQPDT